MLTSASYSTFSLFRNVLPEAICCCLQTCYVDVMMDCVCITKYGIIDRLPEAICCCLRLQTYTVNDVLLAM